MTGSKMNHLRKTHPMVLIAAIALTIFSLIGSAAITGLIPSAPSSAMRNSTIPMNQIENANISERFREKSVDRYYRETQRVPAPVPVLVKA